MAVDDLKKINESEFEKFVIENEEVLSKSSRIITENKIDPTILMKTFSRFSDISIRDYNLVFLRLSKSIEKIFDPKVMNSISLLKIKEFFYNYIQGVQFSEDSIIACNIMASMGVLYREKWPFYLYVNNKNSSYLPSFFDEEKNSIDSKSLTDYIVSYCDDNFFEGLKYNWNNSLILSEDRNLLIKQGIQCYENGNYAACVALLMCQMYGIISDIKQYLEENEIMCDKNDFLEKYNKFHPNNNKNDEDIIRILSKPKKQVEKDNLLIAYTIIDDNSTYLSMMSEYLINVVMTSKNKFDSNQPCRNKICHGEQINFNTKQHALKSILIVDMVIFLGNRIIKKF